MSIKEKNNNPASFPKKVYEKWVVWFLVLSILLLIFVQFEGLVFTDTGIDECEIGTAANDILNHQLKLPFHYYQTAFGSHEGLLHRAYITAFFFKTIGTNTLGLRAINILFILGFGILMYCLLKKTGNHPVILWSYSVILVVLLAFSGYTYFFVKNDDSMIDICLLSLLSLLFIIMIFKENEEKNVKKQNLLLFLLFIILGLGVYANPAAFPLIAACFVIVFAFSNKICDALKKTMVALCGLVIGLIPWLIFNFSIGRSVAFTIRGYKYINFDLLTVNYLLTNLRNAFLLNTRYLMFFNYVFLIGIIIGIFLLVRRAVRLIKISCKANNKTGGKAIIKKQDECKQSKQSQQEQNKQSASGFLLEIILVFTSLTCSLHYLMLNMSSHGHLKSISYYIPILFFTIILTISTLGWLLHQAIKIANHSLYWQYWQQCRKTVVRIFMKFYPHKKIVIAKIIVISSAVVALIIVFWLLVSVSQPNLFFSYSTESNASKLKEHLKTNPALVTCDEDFAYQVGESQRLENKSKVLMLCAGMKAPLDEFCAAGIGAYDYNILVAQENNSINSTLSLYHEDVILQNLKLSQEKKNALELGLLRGHLIGGYKIMGLHPTIPLPGCNAFLSPQEKEYCEIGLGARLGDKYLQRKLGEAGETCYGYISDNTSKTYANCVTGFCMNKIFGRILGLFDYEYKYNSTRFLERQEIFLLENQTREYCLEGINMLSDEFKALYPTLAVPIS